MTLRAEDVITHPQWWKRPLSDAVKMELRALPFLRWLNLARQEKTRQAKASVRRVARLLDLMQKIEKFHDRVKRARDRGAIERLNRMRAGRPARAFRDAEVFDGEFEIEDLMGHYTFVPDLWEKRLITKDPGLLCGQYSEGRAVATLIFFMEKGELWRFGLCEACGVAYYARMHGKHKQARFCSTPCRQKHYQGTKEGIERNRQAQAKFRANDKKRRARERQQLRRQERARVR